MRHPRLPPSNAHPLTLEFLVQVYLRLLATIITARPVEQLAPPKGCFTKMLILCGTVRAVDRPAPAVNSIIPHGSASSYHSPPQRTSRSVFAVVEKQILKTHQLSTLNCTFAKIEPMCDIRCSYVLLQLLYRLYIGKYVIAHI